MCQLLPFCVPMPFLVGRRPLRDLQHEIQAEGLYTFSIMCR